MKPLAVLMGLMVAAGLLRAAGSPETLREFLYDQPAPTPECHASTLCETGEGLAAAWFGGTREKHPDVGIWFSRKVGSGPESRWTAAVELFNGQGSGTNGTRVPTWNPVLYRHSGNRLSLYYKVGPSPSTWWGMQSDSPDGGRTWSKPERLPGRNLGPIKNKPVLARSGELLLPSSTEDHGWQVVMERFAPASGMWTCPDPVPDPAHLQGIQPSILTLKDGRLVALGRTRQAHRIFRTLSTDQGVSWSPLAATDLPNPNSGVDAVTLTDGRHVLIYNHTQSGRSPLNVAVSAHDAATWSAVHVLETDPGEYSYPAVIQTADGRVHITYTWNRKRVRHVVLDPTKFAPRAILHGDWPAH
jgi:predicted neuraminidase